MKILISQAAHEKNLEQLELTLKKDLQFDIVLFPEGYISSETLLIKARELCREHKKVLITGYRDANNKDRAIIIDKAGNKILERQKTPKDVEIYEPFLVEYNNLRIGYILCMEILTSLNNFKKAGVKIDFIAHPIGVGMYDDIQLNQWIDEAKTIAKTCDTIVIGTSHCDGSYRNCGFSIPIAYYINRNGEAVFISKSDIRTRIIDLETGKFEIID